MIRSGPRPTLAILHGTIESTDHCTRIIIDCSCLHIVIFPALILAHLSELVTLKNPFSLSFGGLAVLLEHSAV